MASFIKCYLRLNVDQINIFELLNVNILDAFEPLSQKKDINGVQEYEYDFLSLKDLSHICQLLDPTSKVYPTATPNLARALGV
jgi:hypothetical protein